MTLLIFAVLAVLAAVPQGEDDGVVVGVLEQPQCKEEPAIAVRALFLRQEHQWVALTSQEAWQGVSLAGVKWTVTFDGRILGSVRSFDTGFETDYGWTFSRDRLLLLTPGQTVPSVANKAGRFDGWCGAPTRRPLVVVSRPAARDPDQWKPFRPSDGLRARLFPAFKAQAGPAVNCPADPETFMPFAYEASDLDFSSSYHDRVGRKLVVVGLDPRRYTCDGPPEPAWSTHSFLLQDDVQFLGRDLSLVDAGDYDADGVSEILFWYSGYNDDGYTLFYDGLRRHVDYHWSYH